MFHALLVSELFLLEDNNVLFNCRAEPLIARTSRRTDGTLISASAVPHCGNTFMVPDKGNRGLNKIA